MMVAGPRASTARTSRAIARSGVPSRAWPERQRRDEDDDDQRDLEQAVQPQRRTDAVRDAATDGRPDRHAAEEPGQDRRDGLGRVAEDEDELARPDDLVDEAGGAGQHEDRKDQGT
jgi:hypothetical protein